MAADDGSGAGFADGVELVDENDARGLFLGLDKEFAHPGCAHAHEHLDEFRAGDGKKRDLRLAGHGPGEKRLARARRADQEHALGHLPAQALEAFRGFQVVDDLDQLGLGLVAAGHVGKPRLQVLFGVDPGLVLAKGHDALAGIEALHHEVPDAEKEQNGHDPGQDVAQEGGFGLGPEDHVVLGQFAGEIGVHPAGDEFLGGVGFAFLARGLHGPGDDVAGDGDFRDVAGFEPGQEFGVGQVLGAVVGDDEVVEE